jgi:N-acetyl-beta-hexosaminidase
MKYVNNGGRPSILYKSRKTLHLNYITKIDRDNLATMGQRRGKTLYLNMKKLSALLLSLSLCGVASAQDDANMGVIPAPVSIKKARGEFKITPETMIMTDSPSHRAARYFSNYMKKAGLSSSLADISTMDKKRMSTKNTITLSFNFKGELPPEGYEIEVWEDHIIVKGRGAGMFYGVQTLMQQGISLTWLLSKSILI